MGITNVRFFTVGIMFAGFSVVVILRKIGQCFDLSASDWAAWVQAVGSVAAIIGAVVIATRSDVKRRQEPIFALSAILERAAYFGRILPMQDRPAGLDLKMFFINVTPQHIDDLERALMAFPLDRLMDYGPINAIFEMQDAIRCLRPIVALGGKDSNIWSQSFFLNLLERQRVQVKMELAMAHLQLARDGAGIR